ncbi:unnamed protein product [Polarella glacialis]|uniref:Fibronectin type-III domain-containing protein n=1 Tax=Polarella glacialis TaxID=89957 RepID=A0A813FTQ8_POLGL|nr:unnamed protein product [Polarella glacialis]CAE8685246.1 unnamed protein product [Polarella glacialis]
MAVIGMSTLPPAVPIRRPPTTSDTLMELAKSSHRPRAHSRHQIGTAPAALANHPGWSTPQAAEWVAYRRTASSPSQSAASRPARAPAASESLSEHPVAPSSQARAQTLAPQAAPQVLNSRLEKSLSPRRVSAEPDCRAVGTDGAAMADECVQESSHCRTELLRPMPSHTAVPSCSIPRRYRRPHVLQVELDELLLDSSTPDLELAWYEMAKYAISLHPSSVRLPCVCLPSEVPLISLDMHHLVSQPQPGRTQQEKQNDAASGGLDDGSTKKVHVQISEQMAMRTDHLDSHFVLYLWCRKRSVFSETGSALLGCRPLPLRDASLYGRWATWDIFDLHTGEEVGQVRLKMTVLTLPGIIRLPHLEEVTAHGFTLNWSEPLGPQAVSGYCVTVHKGNGETRALLCQHTGPSQRSLEVGNLRPGATYFVDIRALNEVGTGDGFHLEASTLEGRAEMSSPEFEFAAPGHDAEHATLYM